MNTEKQTILYVDNRERRIAEILTELGGKNIIIKQLDVGDFIITQKHEDTETVLLILERKTYPDLASSIVDKRYPNQKLRLLSSTAQRKGYIIEGTLTGTRVGSLPRETLESALLSTQIRDGLAVLYSYSSEHTARLLLKLQAKLPYEDKKLTNESYLSSIKPSKKDNLTPQLCYQAQLMQIPGVSSTMATQICQNFPNMMLLLKVLEDPNGWQEIADIPVRYGQKNTRRIGQAVGLRVRDFLLQLDYGTPNKTETVSGDGEETLTSENAETTVTTEITENTENREDTENPENREDTENPKKDRKCRKRTNRTYDDFERSQKPADFIDINIPLLLDSLEPVRTFPVRKKVPVNADSEKTVDSKSVTEPENKPKIKVAIRRAIP